MNKFDSILFKIGLLKLNQSWLDRKIFSNDINAIHFALKYGLYDIRKAAAEHLGKIHSEVSIPHLTIAIDDEVQIVSESAMGALESMKCSDACTSLIQAKKEFWKLKSEETNSKISSGKVFYPDRKQRPSKKSYENLKNMLKKPMNSGKWF